MSLVFRTDLLECQTLPIKIGFDYRVSQDITDPSASQNEQGHDIYRGSGFDPQRYRALKHCSQRAYK